MITFRTKMAADIDKLWGALLLVCCVLGQFSVVSWAACPIDIPTDSCDCQPREEDPLGGVHLGNGLEYIRCTDLGHLQTIPDLGRSDSVITTVDINGQTTIAHIQSRAFSQTSKIQHLELSRLAIERIDLEAFLGLELHLYVLDLNYNRITVIPTGVFDHLQVIQTIKLENNLLGRITKGYFNNLNSLANLFLNDNQITDIEQGAFEGSTYLWSLEVAGNRLTRIKEGTFESSERLNTLDLSRNQINWIEPNAFPASLRNLNSLVLSDNALYQLDRLVFGHLEYLTLLDLNSNQLSTFPDGLLTNTSGLEHLYLANNLLTTFRIEIFGSELEDVTGNAITVPLRVLHLHKNHIKTLPESPFRILKRLETLRLEKNMINAFPYNNFVGLSELTELYLDGNEISTLTYGIFDPLGKLKRLHLSNNNISDVNHRPFEAMKDLQVLTMHSNQIKAVTNDWFENSNGKLKELKLAHNQIEVIEDNSFSTLTELQVITLSQNLLTSINDLTFQSNSALGELDLSDNPIRDLHPAAFKSLRQLRVLYLNKTCVELIHENMFLTMEMLEAIYMSGTPITYLKRRSFSGMSQLGILDLSYSNLTEFDENIFGYLTGLNFLNISHSRLDTEKASTIITNLQRLNTLDMSYNNIQQLHNFVFGTLRELQNLNMSGNPLDCTCPLAWIRSLGALQEDTALCKTPSKQEYYKAACYDYPSCNEVQDLDPRLVAPCLDSPIANPSNIITPPERQPRYPSCRVEQTTVAVTTEEPTTEMVTTERPFTKMQIEAVASLNNIVVQWVVTDHPRVTGYRVTYRLFASNKTLSRVMDDKTQSKVIIRDLIVQADYFICVQLVLENFKPHDDVSCTEVSTEGELPSVSPPTPPQRPEKPVSGNDTEVPLAPIIVACVVAVVIIIVIIILTVVVQSLRSRQTQMKKLEEDNATASNISLRHKLGMWVTTFNYEGPTNEQMAEQTTLTWNIYNPDTINKGLTEKPEHGAIPWMANQN